jgi:hypothetical protein
MAATHPTAPTPNVEQATLPESATAWRTWMLAILLLLALVGFYLPWVNNAAASLSANAYDLAEWVGLAPSQRGSTPPMTAPFFLRAVLAVIALLFVFCAGRFQGIRIRPIRWAILVIALVLALTLQPPLGFFRGAGDDPNYRQLFALSVGTFLAIIVLLAAMALQRLRRSASLWRELEVLFGVAGIVSALIGFAQASQVIQTLRIGAPPGIGLVLCVASLGAYAALRLLR